MAILIFLVTHWYLSLFSQTFFLHRYSAHALFKMSKFWERFFYLFTYITQGSSYLTPRVYAVLHRMHHAYSDTEKDPHTPLLSGNIFLMMWKTKDIYNALLKDRQQAEPRFDKNLPEWKVIDTIGDNWMSRIGWGVAYSIFYIFFVPSGMWYLYLLLPIHYLMGPVHGAIVNWAGHKYGYRNYNSSDESKNTLAFDFVTGGELFQNNHHRFPERLNFATRWWEIDPTYPVIKVLSWLRIIKIVPAPVNEEVVVNQ
jgi:stearoyl-CoA desaturase (delta-9 desaturase)